MGLASSARAGTSRDVTQFCWYRVATLARMDRVLFTLTGSSCAGKTTAAGACSDLPGLVVHDFDEVGVPRDADLRWRQRTLEHWIQVVLEYQAHGVDVLLTGQSPLGEVLASPSAPQLDSIAVCLLDVDDRERIRRLEHRDPGVWDVERKQSFLGWAHWHREHAADPQARPEVITAGGWDRMHWTRWGDWTQQDPRWHTTVIDTSYGTTRDTASAVQRWMIDTREDAVARRVRCRVLPSAAGQVARDTLRRPSAAR
jgi:hypothetical protein